MGERAYGHPFRLQSMNQPTSQSNKRSINRSINQQSINLVHKRLARNMYGRNLQRGFTSIWNKEFIRDMYWGGRKFQRGFASILSKELIIRNMYSQA